MNNAAILIIDDEVQMRRLLEITLESNSFIVESAETARDGLRIAANHPPDLIILDVNMPEVSGLDMLEFLRRRPDTAKLPIVMLSSEADDTIVDQAFALGADAFALKPVTLEELEKAMARAFYKNLDLRVNDG